jgi:hypothetical protein
MVIFDNSMKNSHRDYTSSPVVAATRQRHELDYGAITSPIKGAVAKQKPRRGAEKGENHQNI